VLVNLDGASSSRAILKLRIYNIVGIAFLWGQGDKHMRNVVKRFFLALFEITRTFRDGNIYPGV